MNAHTEASLIAYELIMRVVYPPAKHPTLANVSLLNERAFWTARLNTNPIAHSLLMPEADVKVYAEHGMDIESLSNKFGVSQSVMALRLLQLGYYIR